MTRKSHYTILGIGRSASSEGVRAAFLRLAKECHPDHAGEDSAPAFREIQQAYDVLSNPERRRRYDREFDRNRQVSWRRPEPLTPDQRVEPVAPDPVPQAQHRPLRRPTFDDIRDLLGGGFPSVSGHPRRLTDDLDVDVVISDGLADRGGRCTIDVPVSELCGHCSGTGIRWPSTCPACGGAGRFVRERSLSLQLPPGIRHGTLIHLRSERAGGAGLRLRLLVGKGRRAPPVW